MKEVRMLSVTPILGYGFPEASLEAGMLLKPDAIGADGDSPRIRPQRAVGSS